MTGKRMGLIVCAITALLVMILLFASGMLVLDHSGELRAERLYWKDRVYVLCSGQYSEGRTIAKTSDGHEINAVEEDKAHSFVVVRSFLDQALYVREDFHIPTSGTITQCYWGNQLVVDADFCQMIGEIYRSDGDTFEYETEGIFQITETQYMKTVYLSYENCPVATNYMGYLGMVNGKWVFTVSISPNQFHENGAPGPVRVTCKEIPQGYIKALAYYLKTPNQTAV